MPLRCWLLLALAYPLIAEEPLPTPVRHGIERDGVSVVVDLALPRLPDERAAQLRTLACTTLPRWENSPTLDAWVAREHAWMSARRTELAAAHPDAASLAGWHRTVTVTTTWSGPVISLQHEDRGFAGGNHGWLTLGVLLVDARTLQPLMPGELIAQADEPALSRLLTDVWRGQNGLRPEERPSAHGLFVDELPVRDPLITAAGIEMVYPPYDIGPWSTGTVRVALTREQARPFLRRDPWAR